MSRTLHVASAEGPRTDTLDLSHITGTEEWAAVAQELKKQIERATTFCIEAPDFAKKEYYRGIRETLLQLLDLHSWELWRPAPPPPPEREYIKEIPA